MAEIKDSRVFVGNSKADMHPGFRKELELELGNTSGIERILYCFVHVSEQTCFLCFFIHRVDYGYPNFLTEENLHALHYVSFMNYC